MIRTVKFMALLALGAGVTAAVVRAGDDKVLSKEEFVAKCIDCNLSEKDFAERAVKNADSADVRKFAQRLIDDHEKLNQKALDLAKELKIGVVSGVNKDHKDALAKLLTTSGKEFDRNFVRIMVQNHEKSVKMLEANAKGSKSAEVRKMAADALPVVRAHLEEARKLDKSLNK